MFHSIATPYLFGNTNPENSAASIKNRRLLLIPDVALTVLLLIGTIIADHYGASPAMVGTLGGATVAYGVWTAARIKHTLIGDAMIRGAKPLLSGKTRDYYHMACLTAGLALSILLIYYGSKFEGTNPLLHAGMITAGSIGLGWLASIGLLRLAHRHQFRPHALIDVNIASGSQADSIDEHSPLLVDSPTTPPPSIPEVADPSTAAASAPDVHRSTIVDITEDS